MPFTPWQSPAEGTAPAGVVEPLLRLEADTRLDGPARVLGAVAETVLSSAALRDGLRGAWFGHALHPALTDFPLGAWMSASLLDLIGGRAARGPSRRLIGFGLLVAAPTAAAGLAEWQATSGGARRVGVVHVGVNTTATALYAWSWSARRRGRHATGVVLAVTGGLVAIAGGYLGGHMSLVRKVGTADPAFADAAREV
ncbi:MAG: (2Fe-2S)-binding protein [Actinomycetota bacterium]|nr:(2Fe-2S)-binding protein [Actinomycetota bacterium]